MAQPSFWEDNRRAQEVIRERTELSRLVTRVKELAAKAEDLTVLLELAEDATDGSLDAEIAVRPFAPSADELCLGGGGPRGRRCRGQPARGRAPGGRVPRVGAGRAGGQHR